MCVFKAEISALFKSTRWFCVPQRPYISAATVLDLCWDIKHQCGRARVKSEQERCEILMVSLCVHCECIHYSSHLEGRIAALSCGSCPLVCLLFLDCWRFCVAVLTFGSAPALVIHVLPLSIYALFFHRERESTVTRILCMYVGGKGECCLSVWMCVDEAMKTEVTFWILDLTEDK